MTQLISASLGYRRRLFLTTAYLAALATLAGCPCEDGEGYCHDPEPRWAPADPADPNAPAVPNEPDQCDIETAPLSDRYELMIVPGVAYVQSAEISKLNWNIQVIDSQGELAFVSMVEAEFQVTDLDRQVIEACGDWGEEACHVQTTGSGTAAVDSHFGEDPVQLDPESPSGLAGNPGGLQSQMAAPLGTRPLAGHCDTVLLRARVLLPGCEKVQLELVVEQVRPDYCEEPATPHTTQEDVYPWDLTEYVNADYLALVEETAAQLLSMPSELELVYQLAHQDGLATDDENLVALMTETLLYREGYAIGPVGGSHDQRRQVQVLLRSLGYDVEANGIWDEATAHAVISFKREHGLTQNYRMADGSFATNEWVTADVVEMLVCTLEENCGFSQTSTEKRGRFGGRGVRG